MRTPEDPVKVSMFNSGGASLEGVAALAPRVEDLGYHALWRAEAGGVRRAAPKEGRAGGARVRRRAAQLGAARLRAPSARAGRPDFSDRLLGARLPRAARDRDRGAARQSAVLSGPAGLPEGV